MLDPGISVASNQNQITVEDKKDHQCKYMWTNETASKLRDLFVLLSGNWKAISAQLQGPSPLDCMIKWNIINPGITPPRQLWTPEEDAQLKELVSKHGKKWSQICTVMNWRTGKQVRERYLNQLEGVINVEKWTEDEDKIILKLYKKFGTKWSFISSFLNGRPENMVKNRFYANLKRRYQSDLEDSDDDDESQQEQGISKCRKKKKMNQIKHNNQCSIDRKQSLSNNNDSSEFKRITRSLKPKDLATIGTKMEASENKNIPQTQHQINNSQQLFHAIVKEETSSNDQSNAQQQIVQLQEQQHKYQQNLNCQQGLQFNVAQCSVSQLPQELTNEQPINFQQYCAMQSSQYYMQQYLKQVSDWQQNFVASQHLIYPDQMQTLNQFIQQYNNYLVRCQMQPKTQN